MNKLELENRINEIDEEIGKMRYEERYAIPDGIVDIDEYLASNLKIMWILKEANSPDDDDWDMRDALKDFYEKEYKVDFRNTFDPIIRTTYGILQEKLTDGTFVLNNTVISSLKNIAYVNIKKVAGGINAIDVKLKEFHKEYGNTLKKQIEYFQPNVIICAGSWHIIDELMDELFENDYETIISAKNEKIKFYKYKQQIVIYTYHPGQTQILEVDYCNEIIKNVLEWKNQHLK